jgi:hypothetical protein
LALALAKPAALRSKRHSRNEDGLGDALRAVANGKHRDGFAFDILNHGIPTLSPDADELGRQVWLLSSIPVRQATNAEVEQLLRGMAAETWSRWLSPPWVYLQELEPERVGALEDYLATRLENLRAEGRERGWEIE